MPTEFKDIIVPYRYIGQEDKERLKSLFNSEEPVETIVRFVNGLTVCKDYGDEQIQRFEDIRRVLMERRIGETRKYD